MSFCNPPSYLPWPRWAPQKNKYFIQIQLATLILQEEFFKHFFSLLPLITLISSDIRLTSYFTVTMPYMNHEEFAFGEIKVNGGEEWQLWRTLSQGWAKESLVLSYFYLTIMAWTKTTCPNLPQFSLYSVASCHMGWGKWHL